MNRQIAILGSGSIGVSFAVLFATKGFTVKVWDISEESLDRAETDLDRRLREMKENRLFSESVQQIASRVEFVASCKDAVIASELIQECIPEKLDLKRELFLSIAPYVAHDTVIASSSSAIMPSALTEDIAQLKEQIIIGHPGNPPHLLPVIEVVPTSDTRKSIVERAIEIYEEAGLSPVEVRQEISGFLFNRLQGAVLREAYCLVRDGVATVEDIDAVMTKGLGRRWAFIGPFETVDLNTRGGIASHAEKMGPAYYAMGKERGQDDPWTPELVADVDHQRRTLLPAHKWEDRIAWRDKQLLEFRIKFDGEGSSPSANS